MGQNPHQDTFCEDISRQHRMLQNVPAHPPKEHIKQLRQILPNNCIFLLASKGARSKVRMELAQVQKFDRLGWRVVPENRFSVRE
jgi:hypothetical protein